MQGKSEREVKVLKQGVKVPKLPRQIVALSVRVKTPSERKSIAGKRSKGTRRPLVDIPELDGVVHNRKINLGDRAFLALYEIRLIGQPDFVGGWGAENGGSQSLPRVSFCLGPYPHNGRNGHFKNISDGLAEKKYRRASLRDSFALRKPRPPFIHCSGLRELNNLWSIVTLGLETERAEPQPDGGI